MEVVQTAIPEVKVLVPVRHQDARGFLSETYRRDVLAAAGIELPFVQENHTLSMVRGTVRGLHFQLPPAAQIKLVRVLRGAVLDVALDVRRSSPTFGRHVAVELSATAWNQLLVPAGFAHGFCTLEPGTEVLYKMSSAYAPRLQRGVRWDDPDLAISWPVASEAVVMSDRDRALPRLAEAAELFD